jgi:hypothetical protein
VLATTFRYTGGKTKKHYYVTDKLFWSIEGASMEQQRNCPRVLRYIVLQLLLVFAGQSVAVAHQPGDDLRRTCAVIGQQRNAALDALAIAQAKMQGMTDEATALAAWWAAYVAGLATNNSKAAQ